MDAVDPRYPVGKYEPPATVDVALRGRLIGEIGAAPRLLRAAVERLSDSQLDTPYREGGWTVRQVVHHLADGYVNAYVRFKLALTEREPMARFWDEALWAEVPDAKTGPIGPSLALIEALVARWVAGMRMLPEESFKRRYRNPVFGMLTLDGHLALYAWHGRHHTAHITALAARLGWK